jgi:hypothetical protein
MSELIVEVASVPERAFNLATGKIKVSTANWYIALKH